MEISRTEIHELYLFISHSTDFFCIDSSLFYRNRRKQRSMNEIELFDVYLLEINIVPMINVSINVRCKSSETNVEIACDLTEHGRNSIVFLSDRAESLD